MRNCWCMGMGFLNIESTWAIHKTCNACMRIACFFRSWFIDRLLDRASEVRNDETVAKKFTCPYSDRGHTGTPLGGTGRSVWVWISSGVSWPQLTLPQHSSCWGLTSVIWWLRKTTWISRGSETKCNSVVGHNILEWVERVDPLAA